MYVKTIQGIFKTTIGSKIYDQVYLDMSVAEHAYSSVFTSLFRSDEILGVRVDNINVRATACGSVGLSVGLYDLKAEMDINICFNSKRDFLLFKLKHPDRLSKLEGTRGKYPIHSTVIGKAHILALKM